MYLRITRVRARKSLPHNLVIHYILIYSFMSARFERRPEDVKC